MNQTIDLNPDWNGVDYHRHVPHVVVPDWDWMALDPDFKAGPVKTWEFPGKVTLVLYPKQGESCAWHNMDKYCKHTSWKALCLHDDWNIRRFRTGVWRNHPTVEVWLNHETYKAAVVNLACAGQLDNIKRVDNNNLRSGGTS